MENEPAAKSDTAKRWKTLTPRAAAFYWLATIVAFFVFQTLFNREREPWQDRLMDALVQANYLTGMFLGAQWWARHWLNPDLLNALYVFGALFLTGTGLSLLGHLVFHMAHLPLRIDLDTTLGINLMLSVMTTAFAAFTHTRYPRDSE